MTQTQKAIWDFWAAQEDWHNGRRAYAPMLVIRRGRVMMLDTDEVRWGEERDTILVNTNPLHCYTLAEVVREAVESV
ncbi:MAG: hypothetical protein BIFFINMI_03582 [Phycisphaerae bacterium]|nr:hypothetical protein [Phycisphaerae bacterium]